MAPNDETLFFLNALFGQKPDDLHVLIWTSHDKRSYWTTELTYAAGYVASFDEPHDTYFGLGLSPKDYGAFKRCPKADIAGITCLWIDIDVSGVGHKKTNLPDTFEAARELVDAIGLPPSITVNSGGGLHLYWLLETPFIFVLPEDHARAKRLAEGWTAYVQSLAKERALDVDSTGDLSRIFRLPGTMNCKHDPPRACHIEQECDARYTVAQIEQHLTEALLPASATPRPASAPVTASAAQETATARPSSSGVLVIDPKAMPPFDKWEALCDADKRVRDSWEHKRPEFQDQSCSTYDLSLASFAVEGGWTDQEITDLLVAHRVKYKVDLKVIDYYLRTIAKARQTVTRTQSMEAIEQAAMLPADDLGTATGKVTRDELLGNLRNVLNVPITRIIKYKSDPPEYRLETERGSIRLGSVSNLIGQAKLRDHVAAATGIYMLSIGSANWPNVAQMMLNLCEEEDIGSEATDKGSVESWLADYLDERAPVDDRQKALPTRQPFYHEGDLCIFGADLRRWLTVTRGERITSKEMGQKLRLVNGEATVMAFQKAEDSPEMTTRSIWRIPRREVE